MAVYNMAEYDVAEQWDFVSAGGPFKPGLD
jgi:hypothetical protein